MENEIFKEIIINGENSGYLIDVELNVQSSHQFIIDVHNLNIFGKIISKNNI